MKTITGLSDMTNPTLAEIAAPYLIAGTSPERVAQLELALASVTGRTIVTDGDTTCSMQELALSHIQSDIENTMTANQAWVWACTDLVFGGFEIINA